MARSHCHTFTRDPLKMSLILKLSLGLVVVSRSLATPFCDAKRFDSVFNLGHLIYFLRCGEMWTFDPRLDNGFGLMVKEHTPLLVGRHYFGAQVQKRFQVFDRKYVNFSGFSFQELSCDNHFEDAFKSCQTMVDNFQHLTVLFTPQKAIQFKFNTEFIPLMSSPLFDGFAEVLSTPRTISPFWPRVHEIARDYDFKVDESRIVSALYDPITQNLFMGSKTSLFDTSLK